jgi:WD40 repeat protein
MPTEPTHSAADGAAAVPGYEILGEIGRGGMGIVYRARQIKLNRVVALKMILAGGHSGAEVRARFETEAHAVARLQHPGIVQIYEFGEAGGLPYFSLEYVEGGSLQHRLAGKPLPAEQAAPVAEQLARAVQYAHEQGIIHRDLKPANVLLASGVAEIVAKITDFGLAKVTGGDSHQTYSGAVLGTPCYMAPEQARGQSGQVGPWTDVYALGAILYEMLTGRSPFLGANVMETLDQVVTQEPISPRRLQPLVSRDLETICLKCLQKLPGHRYRSALELADDLARYRKGEPIVARPVGVLGRAVKWARRRPAIASLAGLVLLVALTGLVLVLWQWRRAEGLAVAEGEAKHEALTALGEAEEARRAAETARDQAEEQLYLSNIPLAHREWLVDNPDRSLELLNECPVWRRGWEWHYLKGLHAGGLLRLRPHGPGQIASVAFSPCGNFLATATLEGNVIVCDAHTGEEKLQLAGPDHPVMSLAYSRDGKLLATAGLDGTVRLWDARTGQASAILRGHKGPVHCVAFSRDGLLASGGDDHNVRFWDIASGKLLRIGKGHTGRITCLAFSPDDKLLASGSRNPDTTVRVWEVHSAIPLVTLPAFRVVITGVAFSPDGKMLAFTDGVSKRLNLYEPGTGKWLRSLHFGDSGMLNALAFSPDSSRVALACRARHVDVFDLQTTRTVRYHGHIGGVLSVAFSPDGKRLVSGSNVGGVRVWDSHSPPDATTWRSTGYIKQLVCSPDGKLLAMGMNTPLGVDLEPTGPAAVSLVDSSTGKTLRTMPGPRSSPASLAFSPDGRLLAALWMDRTITIWEAASGRQVQHLRGVAALKRAARSRLQVGFSSDGKEVLLGSDVIQVWNTQTGQEQRRWPLKGITGDLWALGFSPGCRRFVTATLSGTVQFWDTLDGKEVVRATGPSAPAVMAFDRTGSRLALSAGTLAGARLVLYDTGSGKEVRGFAGHGSAVNWMAFSPDGTRLASGSSDNTVKLWDLASGRELLSLGGHGSGVNSGAFHPNGLDLFSADGEATVRRWNGARSREVFNWGKRGRISLGLAGSPDGKLLAATAGAGGGAVLWDTATGRQLFDIGEVEGQRVGASLAFRPDARELAIGQGTAKGAQIEVWDLTTRTRRWLLLGHTAFPTSLSYSPDGTRLASASHDHTAGVWDLETGKRVLTFSGHPDRVNGVAFSPDGKRVASAGREGVVRVWDSGTGKELLRLEGSHSSPSTLLLTNDLWSLLPNLRVNRVSLGAVAYSRDGRFLAACSLCRVPANRVVIVWDARTGQQVLTMRGHSADLYHLAYRPDGKVLASASADHTIRLWDAGSGKELLALTGHDGAVFRLAFSADGKRLASTSFDGSVRVWDVTGIGR